MKKIGISKRLITLFFFLVLPFLLNINISLNMIFSMAILLILIYYYRDSFFVSLSPIFILFSSVFYFQIAFVSISYINVYSFLIIGRFLFFKKKLLLKNFLVIPIIYLFVAIILSYGFISLYEQLVILMGIISMWFILSELYYDIKAKDQFIKIFISFLFVTFFYGMFIGDQGVFIEKSLRFTGTNADPNYMAFYYCIGVYYLVFNKSISKYIYSVATPSLIFIISLTGSLTGLLCLLILILIKLFAIRIKSLNIIRLVFYTVLFTILLLLIVNFKDQISSLFPVYNRRLIESVDFANQKNYTELSSSRTFITSYYIKLFFEQDLVRILFGGLPLNTFVLHKNLPNSFLYVSHNSLLEILFSIGIFGFLVFLYCIFISMRENYIRHKKEEIHFSLALLFGKICWLIFASTISTFPSWLYVIFLLIV